MINARFHLYRLFCVVRVAILVVAMLLLSSCGSDNSLGFAHVFLEKIAIQAVPNANNNSAIPLDLIITYNDKLAAELAKLPARDYFKNRSQLVRDHGSDIQIMSWEIVPGQKFGTIHVDMNRANPQAAFFYANYVTPGDHRARVGIESEAYVHLAAQEFYVLPAKN